jgi:sulfatase maturation enzyme AslB (radical SAM superfamily)
MFGFFKYSGLSKELLRDYNKNRPKEKRGLVCHAPFDSLRFTQGGKATACCFNGEHALGSYPNDSVNDIWFGKNAKELREYVSHNDLSLGCFHCKHQIENLEFGSVKTLMYDHLPARSHAYPIQMEFELHNTCNLECIMCNAQNSSSIRKNRDGLPKWESPYDDDFVDQLNEFIPYLTQASFVGGEPFLIDLYYRIWEKMAVSNRDVNLHVTTNGTILNDKVKRVLEKGKFNFSISIESIRPQTYEKVRVNGNCNSVLKNIDYFIDYCNKGGTRLEIWVCPIRQNWKEIPEIVEYFNDRGVKVNLHTVWFPPSLALWNLPLNDLHNISTYYSSISLNTESEIEQINERQFQEIVLQVRNWINATELREKNPEPQRKADDLERDFLDSLKKHLLSTYSKKRGMAKWEEYNEKANYWIVSLDNARKAELLELINQYPIDRIACEFGLWEKDELCNRLNGIAYNGK